MAKVWQYFGVLRRPIFIYSDNLNDYLRAYCSSSNPSRSLKAYQDAYRAVSNHLHNPSISLPLDLQVAEFARWAIQNKSFKTISVCPSRMLAYLEKLHEIGKCTFAGSIMSQFKDAPNCSHLKFFVSARLWLRLPVNLPKSFIHKRIFGLNIDVKRHHLPGIFKRNFSMWRPLDVSRNFVDVLGHLIFKSIVENDGYVPGRTTCQFNIESLFAYILRHRNDVKVVGKLERIFAWLEPVADSMDISYRGLMNRLANFKVID